MISRAISSIRLLRMVFERIHSGECILDPAVVFETSTQRILPISQVHIHGIQPPHYRQASESSEKDTGGAKPGPTPWFRTLHGQACVSDHSNSLAHEVTLQIRVERVKDWWYDWSYFKHILLRRLQNSRSNSPTAVNMSLLESNTLLGRNRRSIVHTLHVVQLFRMVYKGCLVLASLRQPWKLFEHAHAVDTVRRRRRHVVKMTYAYHMHSSPSSKGNVDTFVFSQVRCDRTRA